MDIKKGEENKITFTIPVPEPTGKESRFFSVPVPNVLTENQIRKCANIHYLKVIKIEPAPVHPFNYVHVEITHGMIAQLFHFGQNIQSELYYTVKNKK